MKVSTRLVFLALASCLMGASVSCSSMRGENVAVRSAAPSFELLDSFGHSHSLEQYRGKIVILAFWSPWCAECGVQMRALEELYRRYMSDGLVVLGIAMTASNSSVQAYRDHNQLTFPLLIDTNNNVRRKYSIEEIPQDFVLDRRGAFATLPEGGALRTHITGPFDWASPQVAVELEQLLKR